MAALFLFLGCQIPPSELPRPPVELDFPLHHLGDPGEPEWREFAGDPPKDRKLELGLASAANPSEWTLVLYQDNVKQDWTVSLNQTKLGMLEKSDVPLLTSFAVPPELLRSGANTLVVAPGRDKEDILVGKAALIPKARALYLSEATLDVSVVDSIDGPLPCRVTIVDEKTRALAPLVAVGPRLAARPGCVYTTDGKVRVTLPAGRYRIHAGRGFEYSVDTTSVQLREGASESVSLKIRREVPTANLVACDTHIHTKEFSGHGDATADERAITLAGEGIELPIATEHNQHNGYAASIERLDLGRRMTPVLGCEVTTPAGHFNIFPVEPRGRIAEHTLTDWPQLMQSIRDVRGVKVAILNHPRNKHTNFVPFADENFNKVTGDNLRGPEFSFDAMELLNSSALRTDDFQVIRDWMTLLNRGYRITGIGSSDSHEVNRFIVGQARTYVSCRDGDPGKIDVAEACESLLRGRALVSLGLLTRITVDGRSGPGDLVKAGAEIDVEVKVFGPSWARVDRVELYRNGTRIRDEKVEKGQAGGEKARFRYRLPRPEHDVHLIAVASGPGIRELYWPLSRPYQPDTIDWNPRVIGVTNPVWIDADGDGAFTSPRALAAKLLGAHAKLEDALAEMGRYDEATAIQAASLLHAQGVDATRALRTAPELVRRAFAIAYPPK